MFASLPATGPVSARASVCTPLVPSAIRACLAPAPPLSCLLPSLFPPPEAPSEPDLMPPPTTLLGARHATRAVQAPESTWSQGVSAEGQFGRKTRAARRKCARHGGASAMQSRQRGASARHARSTRRSETSVHGRGAGVVSDLKMFSASFGWSWRVVAIPRRRASSSRFCHLRPATPRLVTASVTLPVSPATLLATPRHALSLSDSSRHARPYH